MKKKKQNKTDLLLQWNLSFGTPPFRLHKIWSRKNVQIVFVSVTSIIKDYAVCHLLHYPLPEEVDSLLSHAKGF